VLEQSDGKGRNPLYVAAVRLFSNRKPVVGAIHGAAIGGGLGLALVPDFRVTCPEASFAANFTKLGFHPGFGLTHTLPALIGQQKAALMFYTGRRVKGEQAVEWGLADVLTSADQVRTAAIKLAEEIAGNAPLAVTSVRATLRQGLSEMLQAVTDHEASEQDWQRLTDDFKEGVASVAERRPGQFTGR
jgi:enoyl-CoA hydratase/carnithine racemase